MILFKQYPVSIRRMLCIIFLLSSGTGYTDEITDMDLLELGKLDVFTADIFQAHLHQKGEWMFAYHFEIMHMGPIASGKDEISTQQVLDQYMVTPTKMDMHMHMFHLMYAPTDELTAMLMMSYMDSEMPHQTRSGGSFDTQVDGIGDTELGINYKFYEYDAELSSNFWYSSTSLTIPTGSIDEQDQTPAGLVILPYPMQIGSGSYQMKMGLGFTSTGENHAWGMLTSFNKVLNTNNRNYRVGDKFELNLWYKQALRDDFSISLNGVYRHKDNISGEDVRLNSNLVPTADPLNQGFKHLDLTVGFTWLIGKLGKYQHSIGFDYTKPVWQDVNGIQLQNNWNNSIYWQMKF